MSFRLEQMNREFQQSSTPPVFSFTFAVSKLTKAVPCTCNRSIGILHRALIKDPQHTATMLRIGYNIPPNPILIMKAA